MTLAELAVEWLSKIISFVRTRLARRVIKIRRYVRDLIVLEENEGASTEAWRRIRDAREAETGVELSAEEAVYLSEFKELWDKYLKVPLSKVADLLTDDDEDDDADLEVV